MNKEERYWLKHRINDNGILEKQCSKCNQWYPETNEYFYMVNKSKPELGFVAQCIYCCRNYAQKWYTNLPQERKDKYNNEWNATHKIYKREHWLQWVEDHKERRQKYLKEYDQAHPDKIREYNFKRSQKQHKISKKEWNDCKEYFDFECAYCGMSESEHKNLYNEQLHKEHVKYDGENDLSNCVPSCKSCNCQKWIYSVDEWYPKQTFYSKERLSKINRWLNTDYLLYIKQSKS